MNKDKVKAILFAGISVICLAVAILFGMTSPGSFYQWACNLIYISIATIIIAGTYAFIPDIIHGKWQYIIGAICIINGAYRVITGNHFLWGFAFIVIGVFLLLTDLRL